jgi:hypothetical protein
MKKAVLRSQLRDEEFLWTEFQRWLPTGECKISMDSFEKALISLKANCFTVEDLREFDTDSDGLIEFDEFKEAVLRPSPLESWCMQVPWWQAVADAIPVPDVQQDPLRAVAQLTDPVIEKICAEAAQSIQILLREQARCLQKIYEAMDAKMVEDEAESKFTTFKASAGTCANYHMGLSGRVGMHSCHFSSAKFLLFFLSCEGRSPVVRCSK